MSNPSRRLAATLLAATILVAGAGAAHLLSAEPAGSSTAAEPAEVSMRLTDLLHKGGWLMLPIGLCSIIGLGFVIERFWSLRRRTLMPQDFFAEVARMVRSGKSEEADRVCRERDFPLAKLLRSVLLIEDGSRVEMEASLESEGGRVLWDLRRNGKVLGVIAEVVLLLGLFGTVWGMVRAFETVAYYARLQDMPPMDRLAVGIYQALITTVGGLGVAIPCLLFFHYFRGKADALVREMEDLALELIGIVIQRRRVEPAPEAAEAP